MRQSITCYDIPVLLGRGFTFGISDELLWCKDREGKDWQAWVEGEFILFTTRMKDSLCYEPRRRMSRPEFDERFAA